MISVIINQIPRSDIKIQTGGSLERTSQRATSSTITIEIPSDADNIRECDYIEFFDGGKNIFSGTILKKDQLPVITMPGWKIYTLSIAGNKDLVSTIFVDMTAPAGSNINEILFGRGATETTAYFPGVFPTRIEPEGITLGVVDDFSYFTLAEPASLWGRYVSDMLDELCAVAGAWWEITPERKFNMRYQTSTQGQEIRLNAESQAFDVQASKDALTFYSACRCIGGVGRGRVIPSLPVYGANVQDRFANRVYQEAEQINGQTVCKKLVSTTPLWSCTQIRQSSSTGLKPNQPAVIKVGYKGLHDADPAYQALMTSGGATIETKDGYEFAVIQPSSSNVRMSCETIAFALDVYARVYEPKLAEEIKAQRGGTGVIEYAIIDDTITDFSTAFSAAQTFLAQNGKRASVIQFSQFSPADVGQPVAVDLPYYGLYGSYNVTKVSASTVLDKEGDTAALWRYDIEASNVDYRDPYHDLWNRPVAAKFTLEGEQSPSEGVYLSETISILSEITTFRGGAPRKWDALTGQTWDTLESTWPTWYDLCYEGGVSQKGGAYVGKYLTAYGKTELLKFISDDGGAKPFSLFDTLILQSAVQSGVREPIQPTEFSKTATGGTAIYTVMSGDFPDAIGQLYYTDDNTPEGEPTLLAGVNIEPPTNTEGDYTLIIAVQTNIE